MLTKERNSWSPGPHGAQGWSASFLSLSLTLLSCPNPYCLASYSQTVSANPGPPSILDSKPCRMSPRPSLPLRLVQEAWRRLHLRPPPHPCLPSWHEGRENRGCQSQIRLKSWVIATHILIGAFLFSLWECSLSDGLSHLLLYFLYLCLELLFRHHKKNHYIFKGKIEKFLQKRIQKAGAHTDTSRSTHNAYVCKLVWRKREVYYHNASQKRSEWII